MGCPCRNWYTAPHTYKCNYYSSLWRIKRDDSSDNATNQQRLIYNEVKSKNINKYINLVKHCSTVSFSCSANIKTVWEKKQYIIDDVKKGTVGHTSTIYLFQTLLEAEEYYKLITVVCLCFGLVVFNRIKVLGGILVWAEISNFKKNMGCCHNNLCL